MKWLERSSRKSWQVIFAALLFFGSSLGWSQVTVSGQSAEYAEPPVEYALEDVEIGLERTVCFGTCPSYTLLIFGDGRVVYEGRQYVRITGTQEFTIDKAHVLNILRKFYLARFFDMQDGYEWPPEIAENDGIVTVARGRITDLPTQIVKVRIGNYEKQVSHYYGGPSDLIDLIELIDQESGSEQWIK